MPVHEHVPPGPEQVAPEMQSEPELHEVPQAVPEAHTYGSQDVEVWLGQEPEPLQKAVFSWVPLEHDCAAHCVDEGG